MRHLFLFTNALLLAFTAAGCASISPTTKESAPSISTILRAIDSEQAIEVARKAQPVLSDAIARFNQADEHQAVRSNIARAVVPSRRFVVLRRLAIACGFHDQTFDAGPLSALSKDDERSMMYVQTVVLYQRDGGWGYITDFASVDWTDIWATYGLPSKNGLVSGFVPDVLARDDVNAAAFDALSETLKQGADPATGVRVLPSGGSWDGAHVIVVTCVENGESWSLAAINPDFDAKTGKPITQIIALWQTVYEDIHRNRRD